MAASVLPLLGGCSEILRPGVTGSDSLHDTSTGGDTGGTGTTTGTEGADTGTSDPGPPVELPETCSQWEQDCPAGYKCSIRARHDGSSFEETACVPIASHPKPLGASCAVGDDPFDGIDECDRGAMCWRSDPTEALGRCQAFCGGSEAEPTCDGACASCSIAPDGLRTLCFEACDPLAQDCDGGAGCYSTPTGFVCLVDDSATEMPGGPCETVNGCAPGLLCLTTELYPDCAGALGCCSPFCDLDDPTDPCAAIASGMVCRPWDPGATSDEACLGGGGLGFCGLPS